MPCSTRCLAGCLLVRQTLDFGSEGASRSARVAHRPATSAPGELRLHVVTLAKCGHEQPGSPPRPPNRRRFWHPYGGHARSWDREPG